MRFVLLLLPLLAASARACLNDRDSDSLALQAANFPDTLRVITGRFERNPPLFYEMRIRRSLQELQKSPREFGWYDDIGVAFDKLHQGDEALAIMAKKRALLPPFDAHKPALKEAWYRYYANAGTFHAHRFMGAKTADLREMTRARGMIKRAIEIKPNAHFGREKVQLMAMDWILATKTGKTKKSLGDFLAVRDDWDPYDADETTKAATKGLSGLIVLGAAWQSVDVFHALASASKDRNSLTLSYLASLRTQELLNEGRQSLLPQQESRYVENNAANSARIAYELTTYQLSDSGLGAKINISNQKILNGLFPKLRAEADDWSAKRIEYMTARLEKGDHPDTNARFWSDWKPAAPPSLDVEWVDSRSQSRDSACATATYVGLTLAGFLALALWSWRCHAVGRRVRRRLA